METQNILIICDRKLTEQENNTLDVYIHNVIKSERKKLALKFQEIINAGGTSETLIEDLEEEIKKWV